MSASDPKQAASTNGDDDEAAAGTAKADEREAPQGDGDGAVAAGTEEAVAEREASRGDGAVAAGTEAAVAEREASRGDGDGAVAGAEGKKPGKLQQLIAEYGAIGLIVFLSISVVTYTILVIAISAGFEPEGAGESSGVWLAAYIVLQATKPIRIPLTLVLTPIAATLWHRLRGRTPPTKGSSTDEE